MKTLIKIFLYSLLLFLAMGVIVILFGLLDAFINWDWNRTTEVYDVAFSPRAMRIEAVLSVFLGTLLGTVKEKKKEEKNET